MALHDDDKTPVVLRVHGQELQQQLKAAIRDHRLGCISPPYGYLFKLAEIVDALVARVSALETQLARALSGGVAP
jgi:predicted protein tyrosine phosphatase